MGRELRPTECRQSGDDAGTMFLQYDERGNGWYLCVEEVEVVLLVVVASEMVA